MNTREKIEKVLWDALVSVRRISFTAYLYVATGFSLIVLALFLTLGPPQDFPVGKIVSIPEGSSLRAAAEILKNEGVIRTAVLFEGAVHALGGARELKAGDYAFNTREGVITVASRILSADYGLHPVKITVQEGATSYQIASLLSKKLYHFNEKEFAELSKNKEGYLFPETYFFLPNDTPRKIIREMEKTFYKKIETLKPQIASSKFSLHEVLTIASLLEREARVFETRQTIAGIINNRLEKNMPLQIDAVFGYIKGGETYNPTFADLEIESEYNTYLNKGLPPGPIANPGLSSIEAALTPQSTKYFYYLTGRDGVMRYSTTFDGHLQNRRLYLK